MCLNTNLSYNPQKVFSSFHNERYLISYRCGKCAECQQQNSNEWYYRAVYEYRSCVASGGYMLFDTLTYRKPPRVRYFFLNVPHKLDYMCFSHDDTTNFMKRLRVNLIRLGYDVNKNLRYFLSTEYGTDERFTHRPHVHILFYVYNNAIPWQVLSFEISRAWSLGRTDGLPWHDEYSVQSRNLITSGLASSIRVCKYVSKYVQKSSSFQKEIDKRLNSLMWNTYQDVVRFRVDSIDFETRFAVSCSEVRDYDDFVQFCNSPNGKKIRRAYARVVEQYHRQSLGFGLSALDEINVDDIIKTGTLTVADASQIVMRIALPTYYKRKLFYEQVVYRGSKMWQLTPVGQCYKSARDAQLVDRLIKLYEASAINNHIKVDAVALANYVVHQRGRLNVGNINSINHDPIITEKAQLPNNIYNYVTSSDFAQYHLRGVTSSWLGTAQTGFIFPFASFTLSKDFVNKYVYLNPEYERQLDQLQQREKKQEVFNHKQELTQLYKVLFPRTPVKRV